MVGDNDIYEGTGWHIRGGHTYNYNSNSTGIAFIGSFNGKSTNKKSLCKLLLYFAFLHNFFYRTNANVYCYSKNKAIT